MDAPAAQSVALGAPRNRGVQHDGSLAFRVNGNRFATMLDAETSTVDLMLGEAAAWPEHCSERWFAGELAAARVGFADIDPALLRELVTDAWRNRAPVARRRLLD